MDAPTDLIAFKITTFSIDIGQAAKASGREILILRNGQFWMHLTLPASPKVPFFLNFENCRDIDVRIRLIEGFHMADWGTAIGTTYNL